MSDSMYVDQGDFSLILHIKAAVIRGYRNQDYLRSETIGVVYLECIRDYEITPNDANLI